MEQNTLFPEVEGVRVDCLSSTIDTILMRMSAVAPYARCPSCSIPSERVHSHYTRTPADLPWAHCPVQIRLDVRKFFCDNPACKQRIFTERLPELVAPSARKTQRLQDELHLMAYLLGGRAGKKGSQGLGRQTGADTLLRLVRQRAPAPPEKPVRVLGVDDWAYRKGEHYGAILVDLESRRVVDTLPDRKAATLADWLKAHPGVEIVNRDRASAYADGAREGAPDAVQVADRFHLVHNVDERQLDLRISDD